MAKNKQQKKKDREKRVAKKKLAEAARRRVQQQEEADAAGSRGKSILSAPAVAAKEQKDAADAALTPKVRGLR